MGTATVPPQGSEEVCFRVQSFPTCACGSSCDLEIVVTDVTPDLDPGDPPAGSVVCARMNYTVACPELDCEPDPDDTVLFGSSAPGSWGTEPRISVWGPTGSIVPIGTNFVAVLLEDVGIHQSITQPLLLVGVEKWSDSFGAPLQLDPIGAPAFELLVNPLLAVPPNGSGLHYAEVDFAVSPNPALIGQALYFQWWLQDPSGNPAGLALSRGAEIVFSYD